jgi:hypothetical protein
MAEAVGVRCNTLSLTPKIVPSVSDSRRQNRSAVIHHLTAVPRFARRQLTAQANEAPCSNPALGHQLLRRNPGAPQESNRHDAGPTFPPRSFLKPLFSTVYARRSFSASLAVWKGAIAGGAPS